MIGTVRIQIGAGGLPACSRCAPAAAATLRPLGELAAEIRERVGHGPRSEVIMFCGAEAFSHPSLPELIEIASGAGATRIGVETAGSLLAVGGNAAGSLHVGVRHFEIRFVPGDGGLTADNASQLAGVRVLIDSALQAGTRIAVSARVPVCRHTAGHLSASVAALAEAGIACVHLEVSPELRPGPGTLASITAACDTGMVNAVWVDVSGVALPDGHAMHVAAGEAS